MEYDYIRQRSQQFKETLQPFDSSVLVRGRLRIETVRFGKWFWARQEDKHFIDFHIRIYGVDVVFTVEKYVFMNSSLDQLLKLLEPHILDAYRRTRVWLATAVDGTWDANGAPL